MQQSFVESFRLSPQQQHICALLRAEGTLPYRIHYAVRLEGFLDVARLHRALQRLVERNEILRTSFPRLPGLTLPVQVIHEELALPLEIHDTCSLSPCEQKQTLAQLREAQRYQPRLLLEGPLWRVTLIVCDITCHWLLWDLSALNADTQTCHLLLHELSQL
ncbi:MAG: hypothetical protein E6J34_24140 [Chloroflexi bacterium]|nr:MAG: hypothetical protein E6J34_24140 [Chloroflexota bacterium]